MNIKATSLDIRIKHYGKPWLYGQAGAFVFDGVVKSSIYCVVAIFQAFGILHVLPRTWKTTTPCI